MEKQEIKMAMKNITSPKREGGKMDVLRKDESDVMRFRNEMDRIFDDFFSDPFGLLPISRAESSFAPRVDVVETEKEIKVIAEIPGLDEKDIQVTLMDDRLTISGEKIIRKRRKNRAVSPYGTLIWFISTGCFITHGRGRQ